MLKHKCEIFLEPRARPGLYPHICHQALGELTAESLPLLKESRPG